MPDASTATKLRERTDVAAYWFYLLHGADRRLVIGGLAVVVFCAFMVWGVTKSVPLRETMQTSDMVETVFAGLVGAIITSTTLVVSINQLVLSQEIGSLGTLRSRMNRGMDFRQSTDDLFGEPTPGKPAAYLSRIVEAIEHRAVALDDAIADRDDGDDLSREVERLLDDILTKAANTRDELDEAEFGTFDVVSASLVFDYDRKLHHVRRLAGEYRDELSDDEQAAFVDLRTALTMYAPLREYVKGLYIQWTLVQLSRAILYTAIVAITVAGGMVVFVDASTFTGTFLGVDALVWVVSAAFAVAVLPFLVFTGYVLRLATLAKQTLTMEPLLLK